MEDLSQDIIEQAAGGDMQAFETIYRAFSGFVFSSALRVMRSHQDAEEVTQEVFLTVYRKLRDFRFRSSLKTWIYRITMNLSINRWRQVRKQQSREIAYDPAVLPERPAETHQEDGEQGEKERMVQTLLNTLNPDQKACVVLRELKGLSYQEIAETLKININTVRTRLKRAREALVASHKNEVRPYEMR